MNDFRNLNLLTTWAIHIPKKKGLIYLLQHLLFLLLLAIPFHSVLIVPGVSVVKAIGLLIIPLYLIWMVGRLRSTRGLWLISRSNRYIILSFLLLIISILISALYEPISPNFQTSLITVVYFVGMALIMCTLLTSELILRRSYISLAIGGLIFGVSVIIQFITPHLITEIIGQRIFIENVEGASVLRATGVFRDPNYAALMLIVLVCITFYLALTCRKRWQTIFFIFGVTIQIVAVILTFSRAGYITITLIGLIILWHERRKARVWKMALTVIIALLLITMIGTGIFDMVLARTGTVINFAQFIRSGAVRSYQEDLSSWYRFNIFLAGINMAIDKFPLGVGWENFRYYVTQYSSAKILEQGAHNTYIAVVSELGLPGFIALTWLFWALWVSSSRSCKAAKGQHRYLAKGNRYGLLAILIEGLFLAVFHEVVVWVLIGLIMTQNQLMLKEAQIKGGTIVAEDYSGWTD